MSQTVDTPPPPPPPPTTTTTTSYNTAHMICRNVYNLIFIKSNIFSSIRPLLVIVVPKASYEFRAAAMLLFYIIQKLPKC
jgi:hypothetical protein